MNMRVEGKLKVDFFGAVALVCDSEMGLIVTTTFLPPPDPDAPILPSGPPETGIVLECVE